MKIIKKCIEEILDNGGDESLDQIFTIFKHEPSFLLQVVAFPCCWNAPKYAKILL